MIRLLVASLSMAALLAGANPAFAQKGTLQGTVTDPDGNEQASVKIIFSMVDNPEITAEAISDRYGVFFRNNLEPGQWNLDAEKWGKVGMLYNVAVVADEKRVISDLVMRDPGAPPDYETTTMSRDKIDEYNARMAELQVLFTQVETDIAGKNYDEALTKLTTIASELDRCAACYTQMGNVYRQMGDPAAAEEAYKQALDFDPSLAEVYSVLAAMYAGQQRYDESDAMTEKANELFGASGSSDPKTVYNQGVMLWNQNKFAEAEAQFKRAVELDPKMAEAQYQYAMTLINQNKLAEAKTPLEEYLRLAPDGEYAATAKALLEAIGK
jgi:tetratricopeptide (TPR) repeat protein